MEKRKTRVFAKPSRFSFFSFDPDGVSKDTVYALCGSIAILMGRAQNTLGKVKMKDSESRLWNPTRNWCKPDPNAQGRNAPLPSSWLCSAAPLFPSMRRASLPSRAWPFACSTAIHKHFRNCPKRKVILTRRKGNYAILPKVSCEINNPVRVFGFRNQRSRFLFASSAPNLRTDSLSAGFRIGMVLKKKKRVSLFLTSAGSLTLIMGWLLMKPPWLEPFRLLNTETVILYPVSTRSALEAKLMESSSFRDLNGELSVIGSQYGASSFYEFEKFLYSFLDGSTIPGMDRMRLKLETPVGIAEKLISGCGTLVTQDYRSAKQDLTAINDVINSVNESALNMETESLSWRRQTISLIEKFSSSSASKSFVQEVREMILGTFGQLGVAGFSASLLTSVLQTTMEDLLALGICSVGGYLAISTFEVGLLVKYSRQQEKVEMGWKNMLTILSRVAQRCVAGSSREATCQQRFFLVDFFCILVVIFPFF